MKLLEDLYKEIWASLSAAVDDGTAPYRCPVVATVGGRGQPSARVMILRGADLSKRSLRFYTDVRSSKAKAILSKENGKATAEVVFYDPVVMRQVRARGFVNVLDDGDTLLAWRHVPFGQRLVYCTPEAGKLVEEPDSGLPEQLLDESISQQNRDAMSEAGQPNFMCFDVLLESMDWLDLRRDGNVAARFERMQQHSPAAAWFIP